SSRRRQLRDQPIRRRGERHVRGMMVERPAIRTAGNVPRGWGDDVAAAGADIDAGTERRLSPPLDLILGAEARDRDGVRRLEDVVRAAAAGERAPGQRQLAVLALERPEALVAAVAWVGIDDDQLLGRDAEVGFRDAQAPPQLRDTGLQRGVEV